MFTFEFCVPRRSVIYAHCGYKHNIHCILSKYIPLFSEKKTQKVLAEIRYQIIGWPIKYRFLIQKSYFSKCYQTILYGIHITWTSSTPEQFYLFT